MDVARIVETLDQHRVEYLLVGGASAYAYGAKRVTVDFDLVAAHIEENLGRLADAMRELNARLRVAGLSDHEAQALPTRVDAKALSQMEISTWRTDAGDLDVLRDIPAAGGAHLRYSDLLSRAEEVTIGQVRVRVASLDDVIASKEWANRPKDHEALPELYRLREAKTATERTGPAAEPAKAVTVHEQRRLYEQFPASPEPQAIEAPQPPLRVAEILWRRTVGS